MKGPILGRFYDPFMVFGLSAFAYFAWLLIQLWQFNISSESLSLSFLFYSKKKGHINLVNRWSFLLSTMHPQVGLNTNKDKELLV